ncbi:MAG: bifunctional 4-hydroxy-3-methylbut-2-enyl diphosphate reductase/30S ribosomal protein S1 [Dethiobacteria bacterium]
MFNIYIAEHAGFCKGVKRAIDTVLRARQEHDEVYTLGPIVHNEAVVDYLEKKGIRAIDSLEEIEQGTVVIRSHGVAPIVYKQMEEKGLAYLDATCPLVRHIQKRAAALAWEGYQVIINGDPRHPEVIGILGWAGNDAVAVTGTRDLELIEVKKNSALLAQTTQLQEVFRETAKRFKEINGEGIVEETICRATSLRQEAARRLASKVDLMIVIGGTKSSNTKKLTQICREVVPTYQVVNSEELSSEWFKCIKTVGVTAGASTPDWTIKEVVEKMEMENGKMGTENNHNPEYPEEVQVVQEGDVIEGTVVQVDEDVMIDIGDKTEAVLPRNEVYLGEEETLEDLFKPGDKVKVVVLKKIEDKTIVSKKRVDFEARWGKLEEALQSGETLKGKVKDVVPAGVIIDLGSGIEGFMPGSLVDTRYIPDFQQFRGEEFSFKVIELNRERDKVILSRKQVLEEEAEARKQAVLNDLQKGDVLTGVVRRLTDFGAFVDIGGIDGLVHISEISWERVEHPKDVLKEGEEVKIKVLDVIPERERVSLSIRQSLPDPWSEVSDKFQKGEIVSGKVTRLVNFGAFVEILPGVEGLVHISQMADYHVKEPSEVVSEGEEIEVKILDINQEAKRISLSIKEARNSKYDQKEQLSNKGGEGADSSGVTLGDVFGDLFEKENNYS